MLRNKLQVPCGLVLLAFALGPGSERALGQAVLGSDFVNDYTVTNVGPVLGALGYFGGIEFKAGDPDTLLICDEVETATGTIYEVGVTRDTDGHITGFAGPATVVAFAPECDDMVLGPNDVLFYSTWPTNTIGQIKPGSLNPDKVIDLTALGVSPSVAGINIVPSGHPGAGNLKIGSYDAHLWYDAQLVPDANGTYDIVGLTLTSSPPSPGGSIYIDPFEYEGFVTDSLLLSNFDGGTINAYEVDGNGDPVVISQRTFLDWLSADYFLGAVMDPSNGDLLFTGYYYGEVLVVKGIGGPGTPLCFGDGGGTACPCGNPGGGSEGCSNSTGNGGILAASGHDSVALGDLVLEASNALPGQPGLFFQGDNSINGGTGIPFGDGLRCCGGNVVRLQVVVPDANGNAATSVNISAGGGVSAGDTRCYQYWYRDPSGSPCGAGFNLSNANQIDWQP